MMWIELTTKTEQPVWINLDQVVEICRMKDDDGVEITRLFTGHIAQSDSGVTEYYYMDVIEEPEQIMVVIEHKTRCAIQPVTNKGTARAMTDVLREDS